MSRRLDNLKEALQAKFSYEVIEDCGELTMIAEAGKIKDTCLALRDDEGFGFDQLIDLCGIDYLGYAEKELDRPRFAVVYHLLSVKNNTRLRVRAPLEENSLIIESVVDVWSTANWFEREAFDLFGMLFGGHPDLRRLLTDYGFIGHPFRKDFPLIGNVEMRYDPQKGRVIYEPVSIEERVLVPRVIRHDNRYEDLDSQDGANRG